MMTAKSVKSRARVFSPGELKVGINTWGYVRVSAGTVRDGPEAVTGVF